MSWQDWIPVPNLMKQAWDATKLAAATRAINKEKERALVPTQKNQVATFRRKEAIKEIRRLFEKGDYEGLARAVVPDVVVNKSLDLVEFWWKVWDIYWIFVLLRIVFTFIPSNSGYLHPDEYFQSVEVVVGDALELETHRTWEFNVTAPLRSLSLPFALYGAPITAMKYINMYLHTNLGLNFIGPYVVHLVPRIIMLIMSFCVDFMIYQICKLYKHSFNQCLTTLASSYIMLVYSTRTFSNSLELFLTSLLLYLVGHTMKRTDETVYLQELVHNSYKQAETVREKVNIQKKKKLIPPHDFKFIIPIGIICAVGFFNRPTFFFFAFAPLFFWFQRGISNNSMFTPFQVFNFRIALMMPIVMVVGMLLLLSDSLYYGQLTLHKLWHLTMDWEDWKIAPFNFIMYNLVPGNVATHGAHPYYTHLLVNLPILLGPLAPIFVITVINWFSDILYMQWQNKPSVRTIFSLTLFSAIVPIIGLSMVKHQEARFLIPILPCVVLMCAHKLRWKCNGYKPLLTLWYAFNILAAVWFGFIHQAGVLPIQRQISRLDHGNVPYVNLVYSHTYMPPRFPLMQPKVMSGDYKLPYCSNPSTKYLVHDLGSSELSTVHNRLLALISRGDYIYKKQRKAMHTLLVIPTHLLQPFHQLVKNSLHLQMLHSHGPHVSVEALGKFEPVYWDGEGEVTVFSVMFGTIYSLQQFSLSVLNVTMGHVSTVEMGQLDNKS